MGIAALAGMGLAVAVCYVTELILPPRLTVPTMTLIGLASLLGPIKLSQHSILPRLMTLLFLMPFLNCWVYVFDRTGIFYPSMPASFVYQQDPVIAAKLCMVGLLGIIGLTIGYLLAGRTVEMPPATGDRLGSLGLPAFLAICGGVVGLASVFSFPTTIFEYRYSTFAPIASQIGFSGAGILSFSLLILLVLDAYWDENRGARRRIKAGVLAVALLLVIFYFQLLRGDRDAVGLLLALPVLYLMHQRVGYGREVIARALRPKRLLLVGSFMIAVFLFAQTIGLWRHMAFLGRSFMDAFAVALTGIQYGTWTNALMTSMSAVGDLHRGLMSNRWGQSYLDLIRSLPPGFIANLVDYTRPLASHENLAWQMRYGQGGYSMVVAPLVDFHAWGVLGVLALEGYFIGFLERKAQSRTRFWVLLYAAVIIYSWGWFWYGELYMIRAVMAALASYLVYRVVLAVEARITASQGRPVQMLTAAR